MHSVLAFCVFGVDWMFLKPYIVLGLALGGVYALSGVGLVVLYRATGVLNIAFGADRRRGRPDRLLPRQPHALAALARVCRLRRVRRGRQPRSTGWSSAPPSRRATRSSR